MSSSWKFSSRRFQRAEWLLDSFWRPEKKKNVWFQLCRHDVRRVHEKFLLADSSELMAVWLILASWAQKGLIRTFWTWCTSSWWKFSSRRFEQAEWLLDSFRPPEPKNVWFLVSRHDVRRVHEKFSSRRFERAEWLLDSFRPPEPKNVWVLLSRHDVRRVHEKFSSRRIERAEWLLDSFRLAEPKTFDSYFLDMMYVELMKNLLLADSSELMVVRLTSASWGKKRLIPTFLTWCTSSWWKIFFSPIRGSWWLLDSFRPPEPKNVWFLPSRNNVPRGWWKIFISPIRLSFWLLDSFRPPEPKNVWFILSKHDVRRVDEKFTSRRFERADGC